MASTSQAANSPGVSAATTTPSSKSQTPSIINSQLGDGNRGNNFEPLDKSSSNTLKRNPKMELSKTDLVELLGYLEGELQARDIVIAALKSEKMKHLLSSRYRSGTSDPHSALARDVAIVGGTIGPQGSQVDQQTASLEALITQQRRMQCRMAKVLKEAEIRHRAVIKELEEEKRKHEHDTAQGDDITYGLEKERTRLKKELELEKLDKKRIEQDMKKLNDTLDEEKSRQKQIVLLLLAERKKIIMKYIEERKRSEDLAQILSEEKVRIDSMAEGLEEESKKSLQMEAELEKQLAQFDIERQQYRQGLTKEEKKVKDLEAELEKLKSEIETGKESQARGPIRGVGATPPPPPAKPANLTALPTLKPVNAPQTIKGAVLGTGTPMVSSKVVQPTATVSSVPVSGPTTGIARSVTPGQAIRGTAFTPSNPASTTETPPTTEAQALHKRPVVPAPANSGGAATKIVAPTTQTPGKLPTYNANATSASSPTPGILTVKKPPVSRGVPPPVPPNKPVVPPKKEAAYLRRTESSQLATDKFIKPVAVNTASTNLQNQQQQPIAVSTHSTEEEVSNAI
ncbi:CTTNBP2 N-terminal-like protein [Leptopilina boulardi]|uniref:CTTNBP2 N-terminal-like protein n=1 Tax=Leptopilina boulardi TaxID=63433 RepID=UPI0021F66FB2|nr:CTTNBP2 N-terminal-like protein [Leptopilina boulardi]